jgi:hypothetical protein
MAVLLAVGWIGRPVRADGLDGVTARIETSVTTIHPGKPIPVRFVVANASDYPVALAVPDTRVLAADPVAGLPVAHVFSGQGFGGLTVRGGYDRTWTRATGYEPPAEAPEVLLAPHGVVGGGAGRAAVFSRRCNRRGPIVWSGSPMADCSPRTS